MAHQNICPADASELLLAGDIEAVVPVDAADLVERYAGSAPADCLRPLSNEGMLEWVRANPG
jgi:hypothetical protein